MISINKLQPGMVLAKSVLSIDKAVLLRENITLTERYIQRLRELGFQRCYISDDISEGIEAPKHISDQVRCDTVLSIKILYQEALDRGKHSSVVWGNIEKLVNNILDEMISDNDLVCDMHDLETFDNYTFSHSVGVAFLAVSTGIRIGLKREELSQLATGALMHDIGKMFVPIEMVNKPSALTDEEYECMKEHSLNGYTYLKDTSVVCDKACRGVLTHHERMDGLGYPNGIEGNDIDLYGKIYAICDVYDAITSDRSYRKAWSSNEAIEYIMANGGIRFDPDIVDIFLKNIIPYPIGTIIALSNGYKAIVVGDNRDAVHRPIVRIFEENNNFVAPYIIALGRDKEFFNVTIVDTVDM
jgi:HD-GYP domain-containing protein (c-di-GMP phosphodiesterase class II)